MFDNNMMCAPTIFMDTNPPMLTDEQPYSKFTDNKNSCQQQNHDSPPITTPNNYDVICGRGQPAQRHVGNKRFQVIVDMHKEKYANARSKDEKTRVSLSLMALLASSGGRFLKLDNTTQQYHKVREDKAREKVTDALRQAVQSGCSSIFREFAKKQADHAGGQAGDKKKRKRKVAAMEDNEPNKTVAKLLISQHELYRKLLKDFGLEKDGNDDDDEDDEEEEADDGDTSVSGSDNDEMSSLSGGDEESSSRSHWGSCRRKRVRASRTSH